MKEPLTKFEIQTSEEQEMSLDGTAAVGISLVATSATVHKLKP
uniref:Uncharacterized protein n=1 Tax=uncultured Desulfobacterium sp. TaxID=201089 RepID=E1YMF2_9BACT|nr:unknown protein [uncultured Desulfobacterium sp.]